MSNRTLNRETATGSVNSDLIVPYGQFTFDVEGNDVEGSPYFSRKPHIPIGASGVTIGRGFDVGSRSMYEVLLYLKSAGIENEHIIEIMRAAGKKGSTARAYAQLRHPVQTTKTNEQVLHSIKITREQQKKLFEITYSYYEADVIRWLYTQRAMKTPYFNGMVCWSHLDPRMQIVLVDLKYRGDFFGKSETRKAKYSALKKALVDYSSFVSGESEEARVARKNAAYTAFYNEMKKRSTWSNVPQDRFTRRHQLLNPDGPDRDYRCVLNTNWSFTKLAENREDLSRPYLPETMGNRSGLIIGRGYNLRTRHCYKARELDLRTVSFPEVRAREEIVRPDFEVERALEAIKVPESQIALFKNAKRKYGERAKRYVQETANFPTLSPEQQDYLFDLTIACYESDAILTTHNLQIMRRINGHRNLLRGYTPDNLHNFNIDDHTYKAMYFSWARLKWPIKDVLIDLCFTGDWHNISREFLYEHIVSNHISRFRDALAKAENWKSPNFPWNPDRSSWIAVPPKGIETNKRFELRRKHLASERISPIEQPSSGFTAESTSAEDRSLTKLEPCAVCRPSSSDSSPGQVIDLGPTGQIIPEAIQLDWKYMNAWQSDDPIPGEELPDDPPDMELPNPTNDDEEPSVADLFTPIEGISCTISPQSDEERTTDRIRLEFGNPNSVSRLVWGDYVRYQDSEENYHFVRIISTFSSAPTRTLEVTVSSEIDFDSLRTNSVDFDNYRDLEAPRAGIEELFVPIEGINCSILPQVESQRNTKDIILKFTDPQSIKKLRWGYYLRYQDKEGNHHFTTIVSQFSLDPASRVSVTVASPIDFDRLGVNEVDFDDYHDLEGPSLQFQFLSPREMEFHDLFFPLIGVKSSIAPKDAAEESSNLVVFPDIEDLNVLATGYRVRLRYEGELDYQYIVIESVNDTWVELAGDIEFERLSNEPVQFDIPLLLPLNKMGLGSLLGDLLPSIDTAISSAKDILQNIAEYVKVERNAQNEISGISIPINLTMYIPKFDSFDDTEIKSDEESVSRQPLVFYCSLRFKKIGDRWVLDKDTLGRFYLQFPLSNSKQIVDFGIFSIVIPERPVPKVRDGEEEEPITPDQSDVYFDLTKREFGFTFKTIEDRDKEDLQLYFPGGMSDEVTASPGSANYDAELLAAAEKRFQFEIDAFDPNQPDKKVSEIADKKDVTYLRLNSEGLSIKAKVTTNEVVVDKDPGLLKAIKFKPKQESKGVESQIVIVNNVIKEATVFASMLLPGFKNLEAAVSATLKQDKPGAVPSVVATLDLENGDDSALAELDLKMVQMSIDSIRLKLAWENRKWDFDAHVDGKISLTGAADILEDLKDLKDQAAVAIKNLNLKELNFPKIGLDLDLEKPISMNILDDLFSCSVGKLGLDWDYSLDDIQNINGTLKCKDTSFTFNKPDTMEVEVTTSNLDVQFGNNRFNIDLPDAIGLRVVLGESVTFEGTLGWVEKDEGKTRYFYAQGSVKMEGLDIEALLKFGSLTKDSGEKAINFVLYAETGLEMELFAGVVLKRIGGGVGINNKLKLFDSSPSESEIIKKISEVTPDDSEMWPGHINAWKEVEKGGIYVSIVASATIASNRGSSDTFNAYIMNLILSLDSNFDIVAVGRLWLASSLGYLEKNDNKNRPALLGALVLSAREKRLGVELTSLKNPAIESSKLLSDVLSKVTTKLAFRLTPELVDYHLQEVSFKDNLLGMNVEISGHYRFAIYRRALLVKSGIHIAGYYRESFRCSIGGFKCNGSMFLDAEYGGLFSKRGINLYGLVRAGLSFEASAFIDIVFRISFKIFGKRISWSFTIRFSISLPTIQISLRAGVAISERGAIGFEGKLGVSISICGYRLSMEPSIAYNPHVLTEVRDRVVAFEKLLDEAVRGQDVRGEFLGFANLSKENFNLVDSVQLIHEKDSFTPPQERWLHYFSVHPHESNAELKILRNCYIPSTQSEWLTPYYEEEGSARLVDDVQRVTVGKHVGDKTPLSYEILDEEDTPKPNLIRIRFEEVINTDITPLMPLVVLSSDVRFQTIWYVLEVEERELLATRQPPLPIFREGELSEVTFESSDPIAAQEGDKLFVPKKVFYAPWRDDNRRLFVPDPTAEEASSLEQINALFFESSIRREDEELDLPVEYDIIRDPRVESSSREFMPLTAQLLPEDVWSARFKELPQEVDLSNTRRDELAMIAKYEFMQKVATHERRHRSEDLSTQEQQKQSQAQVMKLLLDDLNTTEPRFFKTWSRNRDGVSHIFGLIDQEEVQGDVESLVQRNTPDEVYFLRSEGISRAPLESPDLSGEGERSFYQLVTPLKVRQDFILNDSSGVDESAKIRVSLPVKYSEAFFEENKLDQIGTFEIYRNGSESPIATDLQPSYWTYRDEREIARGEITNPAGGELSIRGVSAAQLEAYSANYYFVLSLQAKENHELRRTMRLNYNPQTQTLHGEISSFGQDAYYVLKIVHKKTQLVLEPYLFYDDIPVKNRSLNFSHNYVEYSLKAKPSGQATLQRTLSVPGWNRERLYVPPKEILPDDLTIGLPVTTLVKNLEQPGKGQFILLSGTEMDLWNKGPDTFEIWAQEIPMTQNGFYAGDAEKQAAVDENQIEPNLEKISSEPKYESSDGKFKLDIHFKKGFYKIDDLEIFRFDCSYKFFIRLKEHKLGHLFPMQIVLYKDLSTKGEQKPKFKVVERLEWIDKDVYNSIINRTPQFGLSGEFYAKPNYQEDVGNFIHVDFEQTDVNTGGVELFYIDQDEPGILNQQKCEVLSEKAFSSEKLDFRVPSIWKMPFWQLLDAKRQHAAGEQTIWGEGLGSPELYYYSAESRLIKQLVASINNLVNALREGSYNWKVNLYPHARVFLIELARFEKSPLNIQYPQQLSTIATIKRLLGCMLLGLNKDHSLDMLLSRMYEVDEMINRDMLRLKDDSPEAKVFYFDADFARRLKGIVQRRVAIVRDLFDLVEVGDLPGASGLDQMHPANLILPNEHRWGLIKGEHLATKNKLLQHHLRGESEQQLLERAEYKQSNLLLDLINSANLTEVVQQLIHALDVGLKNQLQVPAGPTRKPPHPYQTALCRIVPLGGALASLLDQISASAKLLKRMHRSVMIDDTKPETGHIPQKVNMIKFIPDSLGVAINQETTANVQNLYQSTDRLIVPFFNLMDYLGFSVDITELNELGQQQTQENIVESIKGAVRALEQESERFFETYHLFILRAIAPNTLQTQSEYDSYSFVKLAVIPKNLFSRGEAKIIRRSTQSDDPSVYPKIIKNKLIFKSEEPWNLSESSSLCYHDEGERSYLVTHCKSEEVEGEENVHLITLTLDVESLELSQFTMKLYEYSSQISDPLNPDADKTLFEKLLKNREIDLTHPDLGKEGVEVEAGELLPFYKKYFSLMALQLDRLASHTAGGLHELFIETASNRWQTLPSKAGYSKAVWPAPDGFGHRYQCAMRKISRYEPLINWKINRRDPFNLPDFDSLEDNLNLARLKPIEYGVKRKNLEQMLQTYTYSHPRKALFSYQLPQDAARSLKNQIASVRTGYKGCDLVFYHELVDVARKPILSVLNEMIPAPNLSYLGVERQHDTILRNIFEPQIRLFDHERLITLEHLPFYYKYYFNVRALYNSHLLPRAGEQSSLYIPSAVEPNNIMTLKPEQVRMQEDDKHLYFDFNLKLSRHIDNLTGRELAKEPYAPSIKTALGESGLTLAARDVPDLSIVYNIVWEYQPSGLEKFYQPVTSVHMPWSEEHRPIETSHLYMPRIKDTHSDFFITKVGPQNEPPAETSQQEWRVPIEYGVVNSGDALAEEKSYFSTLVQREGDIQNFTPPSEYWTYQVKFSLKILKTRSVDEGLYHDPSKFYLQLKRKGALGRALSFAPTEST